MTTMHEADDSDDFAGDLRPDHQLCLSLYVATNKISRLYNSLLEPLELTFPQYLAMLVLWERAPRTVNDVARALSSSFGSISPLLQRMENNGLVRRERDEHDERRVLVHLTEKGQSVRTQARQIRRELVKEFCIDEEEIKNIRINIQRILIKLD